MLQPAKTKFRKSFRFRNKQYGVASRCNRLAFGTHGLKTIKGGELSSRQIEAARKAIAHLIKRGGKIWIRVFPHTPITRKAAEVPMGAGKGAVEFYVAHVKAGNVIFEMDGIPEKEAREALKLASSKLPLKTKFISHA